MLLLQMDFVSLRCADSTERIKLKPVDDSEVQRLKVPHNFAFVCFALIDAFGRPQLWLLLLAAVALYSLYKDACRGGAGGMCSR